MATPKEQIRNQRGALSDIPITGHDVIATGPSLSLPQWLDVSWFYPEGFQKERIVETTQAWIVLGNQFVYKFLKAPAARDREVFRIRWQLACEEFLDHRRLAPDVYVGLRLLRWIDDEPHWVSEAHSKPHPFRPPPDADDVAIVLRRLPEDRFLNRLLDTDKEISSHRLLVFTEALAAFHEEAQQESATEFLADPSALTLSLSSLYLSRADQFLSQYGSYLDPFSRIAMLEVTAFIRTFLGRHSELFLERGRRGAVIDGHAGLRADNICFWEYENEPRLAILGREARQSGERFGDVLSDVASLAIDLEARGHFDTAMEFESLYFSRCPDIAETNIYRFFKAAEALRATEMLFRLGADERAAEATRFLSLALQYALGITKPFLLVISSSTTEIAGDLAQAIREMVPCKVVGPSLLSQDGITARMPEEFQLERLLRITAMTIDEGSSVVLYWPLNREEERKRIVEFARSQLIPIRMIHAQLGVAEQIFAVENNRAFPDTPHSFPKSREPLLRTFTARDNSGCYRFDLLEPVLPLAEQALAILREIPHAKTGIPPADR